MTRTEIIVDINSAFHLPSKHNQKSHGNRAGRSNNVPGKTSKHARPDSTADDSSVKSTNKTFSERANDAATGEAAIESMPVGSDISDLEAISKNGEIGGVPLRDVRSAYEFYTGNGYKKINETLREHGDSPAALESANIADDVRALDAAMNESTVDQDVLVFRGIKSGPTVFGDAFNSDIGGNVGLEWRDDGYTSTTTEEVVGIRYAGQRVLSTDQVFMRILLPKGTHATGAAGSSFPTERELIVNRGTNYRVVNDYLDDTGRRIFDVEVFS